MITLELIDSFSLIVGLLFESKTLKKEKKNEEQISKIKYEERTLLMKCKNIKILSFISYRKSAAKGNHAAQN